MNRQSYTFGTLKEAVYKELGAYSVGGKRVSAYVGAAADTEKSFLQTLNRCLRHVCLSFPLVAKTTEGSFETAESDTDAFLTLPEDFFAVHSLSVDGKAVGCERFTVRDGKLYCPAAAGGACAVLVYASAPNGFDETTAVDAPVGLPDVTCDALVYLTAAELCPQEEGDRYARLVYDYRDLAYNLYNAVPPKSGRNTFFAGLSGLKQKRCRTGR